MDAVGSQHIEDLVRKGFVSTTNISDGTHKFQQTRKKFTQPMKLLFDQIEFYQAMNDNYKGLRRFIQACHLKGIIKPLPYEGEDKLVYENRFAPF